MGPQVIFYRSRIDVPLETGGSLPASRRSLCFGPCKSRFRGGKCREFCAKIATRCVVAVVQLLRHPCNDGCALNQACSGIAL
jgi:hypothetical protein